jgi:hypothetical protein
MIGGSAGPLALPRQCLKPDPWAGYCLSLRRSSFLRARPEGARRAAEGLREFACFLPNFLLMKDAQRETWPSVASVMKDLTVFQSCDFNIVNKDIAVPTPRRQLGSHQVHCTYSHGSPQAIGTAAVACARGVEDHRSANSARASANSFCLGGMWSFGCTITTLRASS